MTKMDKPNKNVGIFIPIQRILCSTSENGFNGLKSYPEPTDVFKPNDNGHFKYFKRLDFYQFNPSMNDEY
jgi:hypothetical protein